MKIFLSPFSHMANSDLLYIFLFPFCRVFPYFDTIVLILTHLGRHGRWPGARPTNGISIEFKIPSNFVVPWFKSFPTDHNEILHTPGQCYCRDVCTIMLWSVESVMNKSISKFHWISNSIEISLVGQAPGRKGSQQSTKVSQRSPWNLRSTRPSSNMASALVQIMPTRWRWIKLICVIIICFSIRPVSSDSHLSDKAKIVFLDNRMCCFHNLCWLESHQFYLFVSGCYIWLHPQKIFDMPQCIALMLFAFWFSGELSHDASMLMLWVWLLFRATLLYAWCICSSYG